MQKLRIKRCSRCNKEDVEFGKDAQRHDGLANICKECASEKAKEITHRAKDNYRKLCLELTGLTCEHCGFTHTTPAPFDWHHIGDKDVEVSRLSRTIDQTKLKEEISKCIFLCKNCHAIEHERLRKEGEKI